MSVIYNRVKWAGFLLAAQAISLLFVAFTATASILFAIWFSNTTTIVARVWTVALVLTECLLILCLIVGKYVMVRVEVYDERDEEALRLDYNHDRNPSPARAACKFRCFGWSSMYQRVSKPNQQVGITGLSARFNDFRSPVLRRSSIWVRSGWLLLAYEQTCS